MPHTWFANEKRCPDRRSAWKRPRVKFFRRNQPQVGPSSAGRCGELRKLVLSQPAGVVSVQALILGEFWSRRGNKGYDTNATAASRCALFYGEALTLSQRGDTNLINANRFARPPLRMRVQGRAQGQASAASAPEGPGTGVAWPTSQGGQGGQGRQGRQKRSSKELGLGHTPGTLGPPGTAPAPPWHRRDRRSVAPTGAVYNCTQIKFAPFLPCHPGAGRGGSSPRAGLGKGCRSTTQSPWDGV